MKEYGPSLAWKIAVGLTGVLAPAFAVQAAENIVPEVAHAPAIVLNDSGMAFCSDSAGHYSLHCARTGQDGQYGRDKIHPNQKDGAYGFSFAKVCNSGQAAGTGTCLATAALGTQPDDWACTRDLVTGLTWEVKTDDGSLRDMHQTWTNYNDRRPGDASVYSEKINAAALCGITTWRLPNMRELMGIRDYDLRLTTTAIDENWFPNTMFGGKYYPGSQYWASNGALGNWAMQFNAGDWQPNTESETPDQSFGVRLVAGALPAIPAQRFQTFGDQTKDTLTGLIWMRCVQGETYTGVGCSGTPTEFTTVQAASYAYFISVSTGVAWRMPNIKELQSLYDDRLGVYPALDTAAFPDRPAGNFISSTPALYFYFGAYGQQAGFSFSGSEDGGMALFVRDPE